MNKENYAPWFMVMSLFFLPLSTALTNMFAVLSVVIFIVQSGFQKTLGAQLKYSLQNPYTQGVLGFLGLYLVGGLYTQAPWADVWQSYQDIIKLSLVVLFIPLMAGAKPTANNRTLWFNRACYALILAMIVTMAFAVLKEGFGLPIGQKYTHAAVFKNYIKTNFFMAFAAFLLAHVAWTQPRFRIPALGFIGLMTGYIFFASIGRTGYITFALLAMLFAWQRLSKKGLIWVMAGLMGIGVIGYQFSPNFHWRMFQIQQEIANHDLGIKNTSVGSRLEFFRNSIAIISKHPVVGTGTGSFKGQYQEQIKGSSDMPTDNPHSEYLHIGVEFGLLGWLILLYFCTQLYQGARHLAPEQRYVAHGLMVSFLVGSLANSWFMDFTECMFLVLMGSCCYAFLNQRQHAPT